MKGKGAKVKLSLNKETLKNLSAGLDGVRGGGLMMIAPTEAASGCADTTCNTRGGSCNTGGTDCTLAATASGRTCG